MAKVKARKLQDDDFIQTISDSDTSIPDLDEEVDETDVEKPTNKGIRGRSNKIQDDESDFKLSFDVDDFEVPAQFDGWDFDMQDRAKGSGRRQVDLNSIIQRQLNKSNGIDEDIYESNDGSDVHSAEDSEENDGLATNFVKAPKIHSSTVELDAHSTNSGSSFEEEEQRSVRKTLKGPYRLPLENELESDADDTNSRQDDEEDSDQATELVEGQRNEATDDSEEREVQYEQDDEEEETEENKEEEEGDAEKIDGDDDDNNNNNNDHDDYGDDDDDDDKSDEEQDDPKEVAKFFAKPPEQGTASAHKQFNTLSISRPLLRSIANLGFVTPTPVQSAVIPIALLGKDIVAGAVTGSGKTAAYMIPVLERLLYRPKKIASTRVVVLTPTRELSIQVADVGRKLSQFIGGIRFGLAVGGLNLRLQEQDLKTRPDIVVATPGRFIDHIRNSPSFQVEDVEILIIDEADRMLEEGFQKELTELLTLLPSKRQTLLFSATMNSSIKSLIQLSLHQPVRIMINPPKQTASGLIQEFIRIKKREMAKPAILTWLLNKFDSRERVMIFVSRKETAHRLRVVLGLLGIKVGELHGALSQDQRLTGITEFRNSIVPILVCTDLASRGLDIPKVEIVINYDMPKTYDIYLHRVGRTARAGRTGRSISLVGEAKAERGIVKDAVKTLEKKKGKAVSRNVDWDTVNKIAKNIESKEGMVEDVLTEEKEEKQLAIAEMELRKGENMVKHWDEIQSRPKRTWFDDNTKKQGKNKKRRSKKDDD
ncbi:P-loop containing nucleoside triphosphate hydrolase protein [Lipomyces doorenjongii]|uniref:P-loop containing nucleoside triphosphate hydrolase protein n=1 Tax=Lipomyces doorenjongii TaxID=383834 RepID=UPI0034CD49AD